MSLEWMPVDERSAGGDLPPDLQPVLVALLQAGRRGFVVAHRYNDRWCAPGMTIAERSVTHWAYFEGPIGDKFA